LEKQPCSLDGKIWIVADARIDGQQELRNTLRSHGRHLTATTTDAELILHAYAVFGERLLDYIIGDFAFAIWDEVESSVFCACDHFGIRPLYYVQTNNCFLFASEVTALLVHPQVKRTLNETAIGDFLMFGCPMDSDMSIYQYIHKLPGGNRLEIRGTSPAARKTYWQLDEPEVAPRLTEEEYAQEFHAIFCEAVKDRVRTNNIAVEMSGGMDSTSIAAVATSYMKFNGNTVNAYTSTCQPLIPEDCEAHFADLVAKFIGIPITYSNLGNAYLFSSDEDSELATDQPCPSQNIAYSHKSLTEMTRKGAKIITSGFMGDALFPDPGEYYIQLLQKGEIGRLATELYFHLKFHKTIRSLGLRRLFSPRRVSRILPFPSWIDAEFAQRTNLEERWDKHWEIYIKTDSKSQLGRPWLTHHFRAYEVLNLPLRVVYPFLDIRLVEYAMTLPNFIKHNKRILRKAMHKQLPVEILTRPKYGLPGDILRTKIMAGMYTRAPNDLKIVASKNYINMDKYLVAYDHYCAGKGKESTFWSAFILLPIALDEWLSKNSIL